MRSKPAAVLVLSLPLGACNEAIRPSSVARPHLVKLRATIAPSMTSQSFFTAWSWADTFRVSPIQSPQSQPLYCHVPVPQLS